MTKLEKLRKRLDIIDEFAKIRKELPTRGLTQELGKIGEKFGYTHQGIRDIISRYDQYKTPAKQKKGRERLVKEIAQEQAKLERLIKKAQGILNK